MMNGMGLKGPYESKPWAKISPIQVEGIKSFLISINGGVKKLFLDQKCRYLKWV